MYGGMVDMFVVPQSPELNCAKDFLGNPGDEPAPLLPSFDLCNILELEAMFALDRIPLDRFKWFCTNY